MTEKQERALTVLSEGNLLPDDFYRRMWPEGRYSAGRDPGSMGGGPSRAQCAANWFLGRLDKKGWVHREFSSGAWREWRILPAGRRALAAAGSQS